MYNSRVLNFYWLKSQHVSFISLLQVGNIDGPKLHQTLEFLKPDNIRDKKRRPRTDADYDCRTLHIPEEFKRNTTPVRARIPCCAYCGWLYT